MIELRWIEHGSPDYDQAIRLRFQVLREPLGLTFTPEQLAAEHSHYHLGAFSDGADLVGCLVLTPLENSEIQMRQVAVDPLMQGSGIGSEMVPESERFAAELGFIKMVVHARDTAVPFYLKHGYEMEGEPFEEVTIPHQLLVKTLARRP